MIKNDSDERKDASFLARLSPMTRRAIRALVTSGFAEQALEEQESETMFERHKLVGELSDIEKRMAAGMPELEAASVRAARELEEAEKRVAAARERSWQAISAARGHEMGLSLERRRVVDELLESADARLADFIFYTAHIRDAQLPSKLQVWPDEAKRLERIEPAISSNIEDFKAAKSALTDAISSAKAAQLRALSRLDVTELVGLACQRLAPILAPVYLNPPSLAAASGEVGYPRPFSGASHWIVDEVREPTREERKAERETQIREADGGDAPPPVKRSRGR
jgi:hypothetical protein